MSSVAPTTDRAPGGNVDTAGTDACLPEIPVPGRVVQVRGSTWAVTDVRPQGLPRSPADESRAEIQHVVSLQSLEEDRLGEELTVVWELELGHSIAPEQGLPVTLDAEAFDDPHTLGAFVDAVRWGAVTSADDREYQAPFRSGVTIEPYQLEPLARALRSPRTNLLLADDVGLGKTIEAGLVIQELLLRHRARTVVIVCPPSLSLKWQDEMRDRFGLDFVIVDSAQLAAVRRTHGLATNPLRVFPRVILSMSWLPSPRAQRMLRDLSADIDHHSTARRYAFDILVVDEAHHVAPASPTLVAGARGYAVDSQRTQATRALAELCEHRLFLTATPHNGHTESFTALLQMIDDRRFSRGADLDRTALAEVTVRRLKSDLPDGAFRRRVLKPLAFDVDPDEAATFETLDALLTASTKRNAREASGDLVSMLIKKRFLSSPLAFARTLANYANAAAVGRLADLDDEGSYLREVLGSGASDEEEGRIEHPEFAALQASKATDPLSAATATELAQLVQWGESYEHRPDVRLRALLTFLDGVCRPDGRTWSNERVVIFTEYADTLEWVVNVLSAHGYADRVATISGATDRDERELIKAAFDADPTKHPVRVLVATDAAGEGIDLQTHCHRLVNIDIPFNPSRLEQRIGRIDRYGQRETPTVYAFAATDHTSTRYAADLHFLRYIAEKVVVIQDDMGEINAIIDDEVQQHFAPGSRRRARTRAERRNDETLTKVLAGDHRLREEQARLALSYDERKEALHLTPFSSRRVVDTALRLHNQPTLVEVGSADTDAGVFEVPPLARTWRSATAGLDTRLERGVNRPITFDPTAAGIEGLVHMHLGHPLLQKAARVLRSALHSPVVGLSRVAAVVVPDLPVSCVAAVSRLVLVGRGGLRLHEEVMLTGVRFKGSEMAEEKVEALLDVALDSPRLQAADPWVCRVLADGWNAPDSRLRTRLDAATAARAARRKEAVTAKLEAREQADIQRAEQIFAAFRRNLTDSLARLQSEEQQDQGFLFALNDDERRQRDKDIRAMRERLATLADERAREVAAIRTRYADVEPYVSSVALVFAVTPADAAEWAGAR